MDDNPQVVEKWIKTALRYGVNTFIYDWYWYNAPDGWSGPYLEDALDKGFLGAPSNRKKIVHRVITQYFHLPNYVKIDGCPVFAMFNADIFKQGFASDEEAAEAMDCFRAEVRKAGFPGLHLQLTPGGGSDPSAKKQEHMR